MLSADCLIMGALKLVFVILFFFFFFFWLRPRNPPGLIKAVKSLSSQIAFQVSTDNSLIRSTLTRRRLQPVGIILIKSTCYVNLLFHVSYYCRRQNPYHI